jgi:molybdopterin converting factor small subunit
MAKVKMRVSRGLSQRLGPHATGPEEILITVPEGASVLDAIRRLAAENEVFRKHIFHEKKQEITVDALVTLNGQIVNPYNPSGPPLKDGDEIAFLDLVDGG